MLKKCVAELRSCGVPYRSCPGRYAVFLHTLMGGSVQYAPSLSTRSFVQPVVGAATNYPGGGVSSPGIAYGQPRSSPARRTGKAARQVFPGHCILNRVPTWNALRNHLVTSTSQTVRTRRRSSPQDPLQLPQGLQLLDTHRNLTCAAHVKASCPRSGREATLLNGQSQDFVRLRSRS